MSVAWSVALAFAGWACGWALAGRGPRLSMAPVAPGGDSIRVSVVIPVRDEAARLPRLLAGLRASDPAPHEVIVADDGSTDGTGRLAREAGAHVIAVSPPAGWLGKPWACAQGAAEATGDVLLFLDADTEPGPGFVHAMGAAAEVGELVSVQPRHRMERWYEKLSAGPALVALLGAGLGRPPRRRWWQRPVAFGPAIAVRRDRYTAFGGHAGVRAEIAEDLALARVADAAGTPTRALLGGAAVAYRMYPDGVRPLVDGWSKNLAAGARATPPVRLLATVLWVAGALQAPLLFVAPDQAVTWIAVIAYAAFVVQVAVVLQRIGRFGGLVPLLYPVALAVFIVLFVRSWVLAACRRSVSWRGRPVRVTAS